MTRMMTLACLMLLSACAADSIYLKNPKTGAVNECKYGMWSTTDTVEECAKMYEKNGYTRLGPDGQPLNPPKPALPAAGVSNPTGAAPQPIIHHITQ